MADHSSLEQLLDLVEGRLDPEHARLVERTLTGEHAETMRWLAWFRDTASTVRFTGPSPELVGRLHAMVPARPGLLERLTGRLRSATLVELSNGGPLVAGARGATTEPARQLLFETPDGTDVVLRLSNLADGGVRIDGQVLADQPDRDVAFLAGPFEQLVRTDEFGEFGLEVPADVVRAERERDPLLLIGGDDDLIRIDLGGHLAGDARKDT
ncbi:MAG: hypothetical protein AB7W59_16315 [Acidimicrobiia bacterium]